MTTRDRGIPQPVAYQHAAMFLGFVTGDVKLLYPLLSDRRMGLNVSPKLSQVLHSVGHEILRNPEGENETNFVDTRIKTVWSCTQVYEL